MSVTYYLILPKISQGSSSDGISVNTYSVNNGYISSWSNSANSITTQGDSITLTKVTYAPRYYYSSGLQGAFLQTTNGNDTYQDRDWSFSGSTASKSYNGNSGVNFLTPVIIPDNESVYQTMKENTEAFTFVKCVAISGKYKVIADTTPSLQNSFGFRWYGYRRSGYVNPYPIVYYPLFVGKFSRNGVVNIECVNACFEGTSLSLSSGKGATATQTFSVGVLPSYLSVAPAIGDTFEFSDTIFTPEGLSWLQESTEPLYTNTYTVKSSDGSTELSQITESPDMSQASLSVIGNYKTLTLTGTNEKTYTLEWESVTPDGKQFLGLAYSANANRAAIPVGSTVDVNLTGDVTLYEVYGVYKPPGTTFAINLYRNSASPDRVDKSEYLQSVTTLNGVLRDETSITDLTVTIQYDSVPNFNYAYIPSFSRYYYITDIRSIRYNLWEIDLNVDVLMTYKEGLYKCIGFIDRNEYDYNAMVVDDMLPLEQGQEVTTTFIDNDVFVDQGQYVLTGLLVSLRSSGSSSSDSSDSGSSGTGGSTDTGDSGEGGDENPDDTHQDPVESGGGEESGGG